MYTIKKIISIISVICMVCSVMYGAVFAAAGTLSGAGTEENPYLIEDAADLKAFRDRVNGGERTICAKLTADIDLNGEEWTPIGGNNGYATEYYAGHFDGDKHTVSNFTINTTKNYAGFFAYLKDNVYIGNLNIKQANISSSSNNVGGIAGTIINGIIERCSFDGSVTNTKTSSGYAGGIVGYIGNTNKTTPAVKECANYASVTGPYAGGISAYAKYCNPVLNCYNTGNISGATRAGGIIGQNMNNAKIENCYSTGLIEGASSGGISGFNGVSNGIINCYWVQPDNGQGGGTGTSDDKSEKILSSEGLLDKLGSAFAADNNNINGGYPILSWQAGTTPQPKNPHIEINGAGKLYLTNSSEKPTTTLNVQYIDIDDEKAVEWSTESSIITLSQPDEPDELGSSITVTAQSAGTAAVTAVTADGYSAEYEIEVFPYVTTCEITGDVRVGNTVSAKINVLGGSEYDYANYPAINVKWKYLTRENQGTSNYTVITGTNGYTMSIGKELEDCYLTYEIWIGNEQKMPSRPIRVAADALRVNLGCGSTFDYDTNYTAEIDSPNKFIAVITGYKRGKAVYIKILNQNALYNTISFNIPAESSAERVRLLVWSKDGFKPLTSDVYEAAVS